MVRSSTAVVASGSKGLPTWARVAQKGQPADALLKRLRSLRQELLKADQDEVPIETLDHVRMQLMHDDMLFSKQKEIRTYVACCLSELLRLYAPDCPFDEDELKAVFAFFLAVLASPNSGLRKTKGTHFADCVSLLSNIVTMRAFALLCERDIGEQALESYVIKFMDIVTPELPKNVELLMSEALSLFLQYSGTIPHKVIEVLLGKFAPAAKRANPAAHQLAMSVCNAAANELQASVAQHFIESFAKAAQNVDADERESGLHALHHLVSQIHATAPSILVNVIPLLEESVRAEDVKIRQVATQTLGGILAEQACRSVRDLAELSTYKSAFDAWILRARDKTSIVRVAWVESTVGFFARHGHSTSKVSKELQIKLCETDEKTRLAVAKVVAALDLANLRIAAPTGLFQALKENCRDTKHSVRFASLHALGRVYSLAFDSISNDDEVALQAFGWIPGGMCGALFAGEGKGIKAALQNAFMQHVLPLPSSVEVGDASSWSKRLLRVLDSFDQEELSAFVGLSNMQGHLPAAAAFLRTCRRYNGGVVDTAQEEAIRRTLLTQVNALAAGFQDPLKAGQDFLAFAQKNDDQTYKLLAKLMDPATGLGGVVKSRIELTKRLSAERHGPTIVSFALMASFPFVNTSAIPALLSASATTKSQRSSNVRFVLHAVATHQHEMVMPHIDLLKAHIFDDDCDAGLQMTSLKMLAELQLKHNLSGEDELNETIIHRVENLMTETNDEGISKYSAKLLAITASDLTNSSYATAFHIAEDFCQRLARDKPVIDLAKFNADLVAVRQFVKHARDVVGEHGEVLTGRLLKEILLQPLVETRAARTEEEVVESNVCKDWVEKDEMSTALTVRLSAMRFLAARSIAYANHDEAEKYAKPTLRALLTAMTQGEFVPGLCGDSDAAKARLRCESACLILKLARKTSCDRLIGVTDFQLLSQVFQDAVWQVRHSLLRKYLKYFLRRSAHLPARYYTLGFIIAFDPEDESRNMVRNACVRLRSAMAPEQRLRYFDIGLARLIHLLNHHPDFENAVQTEADVSLDALEEVSRYFEFYLNSCATADNLACLHHIVTRCKGMRDIADQHTSGTAEDDGRASKGLHSLSDLCICLLRRRADTLGCVVGDWQGSIALPRDLFMPYASREEQNKVLKRSYLSDEAIELFTQPERAPTRGKSGTASSSSNKRNITQMLERSAPLSKQNRKKTKANGKGGAKAKRRAEETDESDEEPHSSSGDDATSDGKQSDASISEDETVPVSSDEEEGAAGRGARVRRQIRQQKRMRNEGRKRRREERAAMS